MNTFVRIPRSKREFIAINHCRHQVKFAKVIEVDYIRTRIFICLNIGHEPVRIHQWDRPLYAPSVTRPEKMTRQLLQSSRMAHFYPHETDPLPYFYSVAICKKSGDFFLACSDLTDLLRCAGEGRSKAGEDVELKLTSSLGRHGNTFCITGFLVFYFRR